MIVEYLHYSIPADQQAGFVQDYTTAHIALMQSPHALSFDLSQCVEDPSQFILRIEWTSQDDHLQGFRSSTEFRTFLAPIRKYMPMIAEMRHYRPLLHAPD